MEKRKTIDDRSKAKVIDHLEKCCRTTVDGFSEYKTPGLSLAMGDVDVASMVVASGGLCTPKQVLRIREKNFGPPPPRRKPKPVSPALVLAAEATGDNAYVNENEWASLIKKVSEQEEAVRGEAIRLFEIERQFKVYREALTQTLTTIQASLDRLEQRTQGLTEWSLKLPSHPYQPNGAGKSPPR